MQALLDEIRACEICAAHLPLGPRPVVDAHPDSRLVIIGQAPGTVVHASGIPWDDASGKKLREWMGLSNEDFYNPAKVAIVPMGFCYPGKGKSGDLPPRKECAPQWHPQLNAAMKKLKLRLVIGQYAQKHYLGKRNKSKLTDTVRAFEEYLPGYFPIPHPSPRNRFWLRKNPWFEGEVIPILQQHIQTILAE